MEKLTLEGISQRVDTIEKALRDLIKMLQGTPSVSKDKKEVKKIEDNE